MAGKAKHLRVRSGKVEVRIGVPKALREIVGKAELFERLDGDRRTAERQAHATLARFHAILDDARRTLAEQQADPLPALPLLKMTPHQIVHRHYHTEIDEDAEARSSGALAAIAADLGRDPRDELRLFGDGYLTALRSVASGVASNDLIQATVGAILEGFRAAGVALPTFGSSEWRELARDLAGAQIEVVNRRRDRDEGRPDKAPEHPLVREAPAAPVSILGLFDGYCRELERDGTTSEARRRWTPNFRALVAFLRHDDATLVTRADLIKFKDQQLETLAPQTVRNVTIASLRAVFGWALDNDRLPANPARDVKVKVPKKVTARERGFTDDEARAILTAATNYQPQSNRASPKMTAAKRWVPWLAAYSGARITELTQLRGVDVREQGGVVFMRLTPDAGSTKTGEYRDVPLHEHLLAMGFVEFARAAGDGPLFHDGKPGKPGTPTPQKRAAAQVSEWVRDLGIVDVNVQPTHGWRHRLKTLASEIGMDSRIIDAIQGHAPRSAGDGYGDVTLQAKRREIEKLPRYVV